MRTESVAKSIRMLKEILDGKTYMAIAQASGLSRSAVEQRVKALARDLQTVVGVGVGRRGRSADGARHAGAQGELP